MRVFSENVELVYSNRINCFDGKSISFEHEFDKASKLLIEFNFNYDNKDAYYKVTSPENGRVVIDLYNFNNSIGTGITSPIEIARYADKRCYVVFFVYKLTNANPIIDFSLYKEV